MYPELSNQLKKALLSHFQSELQAKWLLAKEEDINREVTEEKAKQERQWLLDHQVTHPSEDQETTTINGITVDKDDYDRHHIATYIIRENITKKYKKTYSDVYWNSAKYNLADRFAKQIDAFKPDQILDGFLARHPWLAEEIKRVEKSYFYKDFSNTLAYKFMLPLIKKAMNELESPHQSSWTWSSVETLLIGKAQWAKLDDRHVGDQIEGYPLSEIQRFYHSGSPQLVSEVESISSAVRDGSAHLDFINHTLKRVDVFRHIAKMYADKAIAENKGGIDVTKMAPFIANELILLSPAQLNHLETMLVNIGAEESPLWICLSKSNYSTQWDAYVPAIYQRAAEASLAQFKLKATVTIKTVDYAENVKQNDIEGLNETATWHSILFGRVLPWTQNKGSSTLTNYRDKVPVSLLLEYTLKSCLPAYSKYLETISSVFGRRKPLSDTEIHHLYANKDRAGYLLDDPAFYDTNDREKQILSALDTKKLDLHPITQGLIPNTLKINRDEGSDTLKLAQFIIYHNTNITTLITPAVRLNTYTNPDKSIIRLFNYNTSILTAKPTTSWQIEGSDTALSFAMKAAARNRFLSIVLDEHAWADMSSFKQRPKLWEVAGQQIFSFYNTQAGKIDLNFINEARRQSEVWSKDYFDHGQKPQEAQSQEFWKFAQIAQMGTDGLDALFQYMQSTFVNQWNPIYKEPAPNIDFVFDLTGSLNDNPEEYSRYLKGKIRTICDNNKGCSPIFKSLSFIAPDDLSRIRDNLVELFQIIDEHKKAKDKGLYRYPDALSEITLYNIDINQQPSTLKFLEHIEKLAKDSSNPLQVLIRIPAWDRASFTFPSDRALKAKYKQIQDLILENQRQAKLVALTENTKNIHLVEKRAIKPEVLIKEHEELKPQPWDGDDTSYPLAAQTPGIQQQLQQAIEQEYEQEQEEEQEQEQEQEQEIAEYKGDEGLLITRINIDELKSNFWKSIPDTTKEFSGWNRVNLSQLFSLWVGSNFDAANVIKKIEPAAVDKIMEKASDFRFGASRDNLPAGFYLAYSRRDKGLILCYDRKREKLDLITRAQTEFEKRNHFTVQFYTPGKANVFRGDYRQFSPISKVAAQQKLLHKFLATEDTDQRRLDSAVSTLKGLYNPASPENASLQMQEYTVSGTINSTPGTIEECRQFLENWAKNQINPPKNVVAALFDKTSATVLTAANLRAFGQLFYDHEVDKITLPTKNATQHFLVLAQQIYEAFGEEHFATWKKYFLDPSQNYSELLTKDEINRVALSIATIGSDDKKSLQNIWWALIEAHGKSTGFTRYGPLWESFQALLDYAEKNELILHAEHMVSYLKTADNFNAQVFLDRLHRVLRNSEKGLSKREVQQDILDNVHKIDWQHNGFYYAARYENHPYWSPSLKLSLFEASSDLASPSYIPKMDLSRGLPYQKLLTVSYRFISQRMKVLFADFNKLSATIKNQFETTEFIQTENGQISLRLLLACLSQGSDRVSEVDEETLAQQRVGLQKVDTQLLRWLNDSLLLDGEIIPGSLNLKFEHIAALINAIKKAGIENDVLKMPPEDARQFINNCGRALKCYSSPFVQETWIRGTSAERTLSGLFKLLSQQNLGLRSPLLSNFPWLCFAHAQSGSRSWTNPVPTAHDPRTAEQLQLLKEQMKSIDFARSAYLPTFEEINEVAQSILSASTYPAEKQIRQEFIKQKIADGCAITYQDAAFRPLNQDEIKTANEFMAKHLKVNFKSQNIKLCEKFFAECIAVEVDGDAQKKRLDQLLQLLTSIDNKPYYNDLGQVLGLLIEYSKKQKGQQKHYSLEQLSSWLESLIDPVHKENAHFPINILTMVLDVQLAQGNDGASPTLLNSNLNQLKTKIDPDQLRRTIVDIVCSEKLPSKYKPVLARYALHYVSDSSFINKARETIEKLHKADADPQWLKGISEFIGELEKQNQIIFNHRSRLLDLITQNSSEARVVAGLNDLWQTTQIKLIEIYQQKNSKFNLDSINAFETNSLPKDAYIRMIILQTITDLDITKNQAAINLLKVSLQRLSADNLRDLALYCRAEPLPSIDLLTKLIAPGVFVSVEALIHRYETVEQAKKADGNSKRHYSVTEQDNRDLLRVFTGLKQKGQGVVPELKQKKLLELLYYVNNYSQVANLSDLPFANLQQELLKQRKILLQLSSDTREEAKELASLTSARMLACMREILLRKTGKWVNHTQMLDLIYAALHNDEKLLHQVRTGQGKSIISMMRVGYLALNGKVVDIFSSKDSLSKRDQQEFSHVLDAMGVRNSYITANAPVEAYQSNDSAQNIGAVNFCTIGNSSLFQSTQIWQHIKNINLDPKLRVAFVDECDFVLKFEDTQFNYSANNGAEAIYNFDEWVYRIAYKYYMDNVATFPQDDHGVLRISRNIHLKELCELLQKEAINSPKQSNFLARYVNPAANGDPKAIEKRDNELKKLLVAANVAQGLQEGRHYSIRPDQQIVGERTVINTRFAKVLIGNQIKHGSTYSDLVQQFLHVRLNEEAVAKGEAPNFFVEPDSTIALSSNAKYTLKKYYDKIEGCTGTAGNLEDLKQYEDIFGITHVVKLPSHEELSSKYLPTIYSANRAQQVKDIITCLRKYTDRPILVTCDDDIEVKKLFKLIQQEIKTQQLDIDLARFIQDTNDSGLAESDIVPKAGAAGKITISSRMGRGTDIKPETERGLMVLRTYPTLPQITKQESGRQGRNGAQGTCIEIIDYSEVLKEYGHFTQEANPHKLRLEAIMQEQKLHLQEKFQKHNDKESKKWKWLEEDTAPDALQEKYLKARSVQQLKYEIKKQSEVYLRRKEFLIASLSGDVIDVLHINYDNKYFDLDQFKENWLDCRQKVEALWNVRLAGKASDSEEIYAAFLEQVAKIWKDFCLQYKDLNQGLFVDLAKSLKDNAKKLDGPHDQVLKFIKDHIEILTLQKDQNKSVSTEALKQLDELRKKLKKDIIPKYHPDKRNVHFADDPDNPIYEEIAKQSSNLLGLVNDALSRTSQQSDSAQHSQHEDHEAAGSKACSAGALTLYKGLPYVKSQALSKDPEFKSIITFYQEWVKGAEQNYFTGPRASKEVIDAIYEEGAVGLDYFFVSLYKISHTQENSVLEDKQRREQLFTALATLKKPQLFLIPAKNVADVATLFAEKFHELNYDKYLLCLQSFFELKMFEELQPRLTKPEDLIKFGLLFDMAMKIATKNYIADEHCDTKELITNLCTQIHKEFWEQFDEELADNLVEVFAYSPNTASLLAAKKLDFDLHHFIKLVNHNKDAEEEVRTKHIQQLGTYLDKHHEQLAKGRLGALRPLFQIVLGETQVEALQESYLPEPNTLNGLPNELEKDFWTFISQRQPLTQKAINYLIEILRGGFETEDFQKKVFTPLIELAPYVSIDYITEHLKSTISRTNYSDLKRALSTIQESAEVFNKFAHQVGLTAADRNFSHDKQESYDDFVSLFNQMTPEQNKLFFTLCAENKYAGASLDSILALGRAWHNKQITGGGNKLDELLVLATEINKLPKSCQHRVEMMYNNSMNNPASMQKVRDFVSKTKGVTISAAMMKSIWDAEESDRLKTEKALNASIQFAKKAAESPALAEGNIDAVYQEWIKDTEKDALMLEQSLEIMEEITALQAKYSHLNMLNDFMKNKHDAAIRARYLEFLSAIKGKDINAASMVKLAQAWTTKRILSRNQLSDCINIIGIAQELNKSNNWADYFLHFAKNSKIRQKIMQVLHHDILDLGKIFADKCYSEYEKMVGREIQVPDLSKKMDLMERRRALTSNYRKIVAFTEEIINIDKGITSNVVSHSSFGGYGLTQHKSFFNEQQRSYASEWWKNSQRKEQANTLFASLSSIRTNQDRTEFFKTSLEQIWFSQQDILHSDKNTKRNSKGYSRLYDITVQMSIYLANEFIKDPEISIADKLLLNTKIKDQMEYHIELLGSRLPKDHQYKSLFRSYDKNTMTHGSTDLEEFLDRIQRVDMDLIPKHLRYLMTNIECFIDVSGRSRQVDLGNKENYGPQPILVY
jgi:hypothetical protein